jgi:glycine cleavage system H protein
MKFRDYEVPENLRYHKEHCWVKDAGQGEVIIGWTDFAQQLAQEITSLFVPEEGKPIKKDQYMGTIETGKWVGKVYSPVDGTILEVNESVMDRPRVINEDPYGEGWVLKVKLSSPDQLKTLLNSTGYVEAMKVKLKELGKL